jgi:hypothetical protein
MKVPTRVTVLWLAAPILAFATACSGGTGSEPTAEPTVPTVVPTREPPTAAPTEAASEGGLMAIAVAGPAVQVLSGIGDQATFVAGVPASVSLIAADSNGVSRVEITVDGESWRTWEADGETVFKTDIEWVPEAVGLHQVGVVVYDTNGVPSQLAAYPVTVLEAGNPTPVPPTAVPASPVPGATPPATPPAADAIPPAVSISAENADIALGGDFDIHTNAVDEGGVVKLELWIGGVIRDTWDFEGSPEEVQQSVFRTMIWRNAGEGNWDCFVRAWDTAGNVGQSITIELSATSSVTPTPLTLP